MNQADWRRNLVIFGAVHVFLFLILLPVLAQIFYPGTGTLELYLAQQMLGGKIPYHDFASEYPPLALLSFLLPGLVFHNTISYSWGFAAELMIFDLLAMVMIADLASFLKVSVRNALVIYTLFILAIGPILVARYDILPGMLVLAALWAFIKGKNKLAWAFAAMGFATKIYPLIIIPIFAVYQLKNRQYKQLIIGGAVFIIVLLVLNIPWVIVDAPGFWHSLTYHLERGLHAESTYGTALLSGQVLGMTTVTGDLNFGSWNLSSALADSLAKISFYIVGAFLLAVYGLFAWRLRKDPEMKTATKLSEPSAAKLLQFGALAVIVFLLTNKVFSAQYLAWLCPLLPLLGERSRYPVMILFMAAALLTQYVFPYNYTPFELGQAIPVFMLTVRNLLLIAAAVLIALPERYQIPGTSDLRSGG